ncbi:hypothetical protein [Methyloradius palustris]|uniref:Uncharacterized protein n=1 Tax=Methyloradius palustris TaxID=2778876 RepID=A0A8D5G1B8_9PROT|nr:hypothetical protein [Methyloradius palustris]BCM25565.1 hypothetical protein ZMTM_18240 [Methyloradius palustris]
MNIQTVIKTLFKSVALPTLMLGTLASPAVAAVEQASAPANMVVYIAPAQYEHPIKLWHFYYSYWFEQGPVAEVVAEDVFGSEYGHVAMCTSNEAGNTLVWLKPSMFYNPHMTTYYGTVTASVYSGSGKPLGTFVGESQKNGFLDVATNDQIKATYKLAMQDLAAKMNANPAFQQLVKQGIPDTETRSPCTMVTMLPSTK